MLKEAAVNQKDLISRYSAKRRPQRKNNQLLSAAWTQTCKPSNSKHSNLRITTGSNNINCSVAETWNYHQLSLVLPSWTLSWVLLQGNSPLAEGWTEQSMPTASHALSSLPRKRSPETEQLRDSTSGSMFSSFLSCHCCSVSVGLRHCKIYIGNICLRRHMRAGFFEGF